MKRSLQIYKRLLTVFFALIGLFNYTFAQPADDLVSKLNEQLIPLKSVTPGDDYQDLEKLKTILKDKTVIGMGEATHGTKEFFQFKHRMLEFLVKEMGVKTFVIEADFAGTQIMNDYIINGEDDVEKGLYGMGFSIWMAQEFVEMVNWFKVYNPPSQRKIKSAYLVATCNGPALRCR